MLKHHSRQSLNGFTLIELLVVLAIISVLMAFFFPVVQKARLQAKSLQCIGSLRQFGLAEMNYASDWRGMMVGNGLAPPWTRQPAFLKYLAGNDRKLAASSQLAIKVTKCPSDPNTADAFTITFSYYASGYVMLYRMRNPALLFLAGDTSSGNSPEGTPNGSTTRLQPEDLAGGNRPWMWFGHSGYANLLMADGHVESRVRNEVPVLGDFNSKRYPGFHVFWDSFNPLTP